MHHDEFHYLSLALDERAEESGERSVEDLLEK